MKVTILSALTGNGHTAVAKALKERFIEMGMSVQSINDFYEKLSPYTAMMTDFYNLLQMRSKELCKLYTEMASMENPKRQDDIYGIIKEPIQKFFEQNDSDVVISTTPLINRYMIRWKYENKIPIPYYIVITDPFIPMYPGFESKGGTGYFCPNFLVKKYLIQQGIEAERVFVTGYPLKKGYITEKRMADTRKFTYNIVVNSGANGNFAYFKIIDKIQELIPKFKIKLTLLCGRNQMLYNLSLKKYAHNEHIEVKLFEEDMVSLLKTTDVCVTKPGANTIYECIYMKVPILVDGMDGYLYQEGGIREFLEENKIGMCFDSLDNMIPALTSVLEGYETFIDELEKFEKHDGVRNIIETIVSQDRQDNVKEGWKQDGFICKADGRNP